jgi:hypothetical protein
MRFNESKIVEQIIFDAVENLGHTTAVSSLCNWPTSWCNFASFGLRWANRMFTARF